MKRKNRITLYVSDEVYDWILQQVEITKKKTRLPCTTSDWLNRELEMIMERLNIYENVS